MLKQTFRKISSSCSINYGFSNYHKQFTNSLGISHRSTLAGFIRTQKRHYKKTYKVLKFFTFFATCYLFALVMLPGSHLSGQQSLKVWGYKKKQQIYKAFYYHQSNLNPIQMIVQINEDLLKAMTEQIFDQEMLHSHLKSCQEIINDLKDSSLKVRCLLTVLSYSSLYLQKIILYKKQLLLDPILKNYLIFLLTDLDKQMQKNEVVEKVVSAGKLKTEHIQVELDKLMKLNLVLEYLIQYSESIDQLHNILLLYSHLIQFWREKPTNLNKWNRKISLFLATNAAKEPRFKKILISKYSTQPSLKQSIWSLFLTIDECYKAHQSSI